MSKKKAAPAEGEEAPAKSKKKLIVVVVLVLALAGGGYWMFLRPKPAEAAEAKPEPGDVLAMEPIQVNLAGEHYLRIGVALQATADVAHKPEGSKALDATIHTFSGKSIEEVNNVKKREELKKELEKEIEHLYHGDIMEIYFTEFVTQ